jgi:transaldolase
VNVVRELVAMVNTHDLKTEVLAASIRHPRHMTQVALAGAHIATVPLKVLREMIHHPLTDTGILQFRKDWETVQKPLSLKVKLDDAPLVGSAS